MELVFNNLISSIIYLLIWISFWGLIDTLIIKFVDNINYKIIIYSCMLVFSCSIYIFALNRNINITKSSYEKKDNKV